MFVAEVGRVAEIFSQVNVTLNLYYEAKLKNNVQSELKVTKYWGKPWSATDRKSQSFKW